MILLRSYGTLGLAVIVALTALLVLEGARSTVSLSTVTLQNTPVTLYEGLETGPPVVIAHGFAGSRQMMQGYALPLAQAGYTVYAFDFEGHGRHPLPMSGDVSSLDGTTRLLMQQTRKVMDFAATRHPEPIALLGHSMATDVLVRVAAEDTRTGPMVLLSAFSLAIDAAHPKDLLLITGAWEPGLTDFALEAADQVGPGAAPGVTVTRDDIRRRTVFAPAVEHVAILQSREGRREAIAWLNGFYNRTGTADAPPTGWALIAVLAAVTALAGPLAQALHRVTSAPVPDVSLLPLRAVGFALVTLVPALAAPLLAAPIDTKLLPVLVANYLALHLALYGALQMGLLYLLGRRLSWPVWPATGALLIWGLAVFGLILDRYGANFWPTGSRWPIIAALSLGALPFMLADALAAFGAPLWQRVTQRIAVLISLAIAVALDFEGLFFLIMIAPVIVLFFVTFGLMGRRFAELNGPATSGLALGVILAWALGVSFPLFQA